MDSYTSNNDNDNDNDNFEAASPGLLTFPDILTHTCDEGKCVSRALSDLHGGSFTCYGGDDDTMYPRMCADGFVPVVHADEPTKTVTTTTVAAADGSSGSGSDDKCRILLSYYTCCSPDNDHHGSSSSGSSSNDLQKNILHQQQQPQEQQEQQQQEQTQHLPPRRRCSDPISGFRTNHVCDHEDVRKYSVAMKPNVSPDTVGGLRETESVMCCDYLPLEREGIDDIGTELLDNDATECVPYRSPLYEAFRAINEPGLLRPRTCDFPEGSFVYPRPLEGVDASSTGRYQCCKTGPGLPPFEIDTAFRSFVYPSLAIHCLALVITAVVATALLLPLLVQLTHRCKNSRCCSRNNLDEKQQSRTASRSSLSITTAASDSIFSSRMMTTTSKGVRSSKSSSSKYSTYNLYLVYLLLADLAYLVYEIGIFSNYIHQNFQLRYNLGLWVCKSDLTDRNAVLSRSKAVIGPYLFINLWINCVMTHEILALLRSSRNKAKRIKAPSLTRVNVQMAVGMVLATAVGLSTYYFVVAIETSMKDEAYHRIQGLTFWSILWICFCTVLPMAHVLCVTILIWWKSYIPSKISGNTSKRARGVRELSYYVSRVVAVFLGIWVPVIILTLTSPDKSWAMIVCNLLAAIQPLLKAGIILTKSDTQRYVRDFCGKLFFGCCCSTNSSNSEEESIEIHDRTSKQLHHNKLNRSSFANNSTSMGNNNSQQLSNFSIDVEIDIDPEEGGDAEDPNASDVEEEEDESQELQLQQQCVAVWNGGLVDHGSSSAAFVKPPESSSCCSSTTTFLKADPVHDAKVDVGADAMLDPIDASAHTMSETIDTTDASARTTIESIDASAHTTTTTQGAIDASAH